MPYRQTKLLYKLLHKNYDINFSCLWLSNRKCVFYTIALKKRRDKIPITDNNKIPLSLRYNDQIAVNG